LLGKISDVGLFSDKTEITVKNVTAEDLEAQIKSKLFKILGNNQPVKEVKDAFEGEIIDMTPEDMEDNS
jgi:flagellar basal body-associated protein FliL